MEEEEEEMENGIPEAERHQIEQIRELEFEELQVEEVDSDDSDHQNDAADFESLNFNFDTSLTFLHMYLGEVEDTHHRLTFLEGGAAVSLPIFYLEGAVLFPEATLPLRLVHRNMISTVERAISQVDVPCTIGVVNIYRDPDNRQLKNVTVGTTAEIRQYRRLEDGSLNVLARGQQRFRLKRCWIDVEGVACGEVHIIQEDLPLRMPKDAIGKLAPLSNLRSCSVPHAMPSNASKHQHVDANSDSEVNSVDSFESELSPAERRIHESAIESYYGNDTMDESSSSDDDKLVCELDVEFRRSHGSGSSSGSLLHSNRDKSIEATRLVFGSSSTSAKQLQKGDGLKRCWKSTNLDPFRRVPKAFWPYWAYRMHDSYCLAERAADMWKQIVGAPSMDGFVRKPDLLSFYIASKIPASESIRQELLEIDGISYRLRREIELLARFDIIRCKSCKNLISRRSEMLVMSAEGPLGAFVNPHGFVHEVMTLRQANGLALLGRAFTEYSWFPGYAWTVAMCGNCEKEMGWLFSATKKNLKPRSFWGIRSCQVADDMN